MLWAFQETHCHWRSSFRRKNQLDLLCHPKLEIKLKVCHGLHHHWALAMQDCKRESKTCNLPYSLKEYHLIPLFTSTEESPFRWTFQKECKISFTLGKLQRSNSQQIPRHSIPDKPTGIHKTLEIRWGILRKTTQGSILTDSLLRKRKPRSIR